MTNQNQKESQTRARDAGATRAAILEAARLVFSIHGFDGAGTRDIAQKAGCNVALINRYFGSKAELFREVMEHCIDLKPLADVKADDLPAQLAKIALSKQKHPSKFDPMFAAIRSSSSEDAQQIVKEEMGNPMVAELAAQLGGKDAEIRAALILSVLAGFDVARHLIGPDALDPANDELLQPRLEAAIRAIFEPSKTSG
ncbi:MAG: TetR family transcriptional regulator [Pseudomonadota bacterium]